MQFAVGTRRQTRLQQQRDIMKATSIFILLLVLGLAFGHDFCKEELRTSVDVEDAVLLKNGTLLTGDGDNYPPGTFWKEEAEGHWWVCPCLLGNCIRICDKEFAEEVINAFGEFEPVSHFLWDEIIETNTTPIESFKQVHSAKCDDLSDVLKKEHVTILANGMMLLENETEIYDAEHYCVHQMEGNSIHLVHCLVFDFVEFDESLDIKIYSTTLYMSSIFLIFTVAAYTLSPLIKYFHGKSVLCHVACLAVTFIILAVKGYSYQIGEYDRFVPKEQCFLIGFIPIYSYLASMFWLNTMCIDIFFTFKGISRTGKNYFAKFAIYSFCGPIPIVAVALYFNLINDEDSIFNPNIGNGTCWISGAAQEWLYFYGPCLILLLADFGLLSATCCASSGEPVRTTEETDQTVPQEKERRRTYLMLTLVVCFTFIAEAIPYFIGGVQGIQRILNIMIIFGASRGVLIFLLLVCADKYVRKSLSSRCCCKGQRGQVIQ
ncbi:G-protein coupled receptor Mth2-like [Cloeon dipterum]|uniref:G-protein coupled receptor Mth2-like n=1 Tax=Cloeon dipterum TaxID=197152 RepID=UPI00321FF21B